MMNRKALVPALLAAGLMAAVAVSSCQKTDQEKIWEEYAEWRDANDEWLREITVSGNYTRVVPEWNRDISVLMRWLNDTTKTSGNLVPLYTSSITVKYKGWLYEGTPFDSSYAYTDSVSTMTITGLIGGWVAALERMHVGDKVELVVPYQAAYGSSSNGAVPPYSNLRFLLELRDIPNYETRPSVSD